MSDIEYAAIPPRISYARGVQQLTLQDVRLGGFPRPEQIAHPNRPSLVIRQLDKLRRYPENYEGAFIDEELVGYVKTAEWHIADEIPFASEQAQVRLRGLQRAGVSIDPNLKLGIFGLVADDLLMPARRDEIVDHLLDTAVERGHSMGVLAVNIIFHDRDPAQPVAVAHGFRPTGRVGIASGAPGLIQRLYQKPLDS